MAKYVIDIPDEKIYAYVNEDKTFLRVPISAGENNIKSVFAPTMLRITPYTEPDEDEIRQKAREEVWDFVFKFEGESEKINECFGMDSLLDVMSSMTYSEAKAKCEEWRKRKDEIRVGCEVRHKEVPELKIYVTDMNDNSFGGFALCRVEDVCDYGDRFSECNVHSYKPTGRMLPNIVELLKKMGEG